jgi:endoglucanase|uniref:M42 family peptidase n=1 Tax=candidate division WOR-3 bacterium TaxID=2052148 RepID=A0A7V3RHG4_UNCW3
MNEKEYLDEILKKLCESYWVGYSGEINEVLLKELRKFTKDARSFPDGSIYGLLTGTKKTNVMLACHIDEIGFIVNYIEDNGFIRFRPVGGCDQRILPGQEVVILGRKKIKGYIGIKPPHLMKKDEFDKVQPIDKLFIDTGLKPEAVRRFISIGDFICFAGYYNKLQGDFRSAKSLDNRASVACAIMILRELDKIGSPVNVHFIATNQEEFSGLGARVHSYRIKLDYGIVIDVTHGEYPGLAEGEYFSLEKGPVIARGATIPQKLFKLLLDSAKSKEIPYQIEAIPGYTGTDADAIAFNKEGIPTCVLGIPLRYMHTPVEVVSLKDIERTARLVVEFIRRI